MQHSVLAPFCGPPETFFPGHDTVGAGHPSGFRLPASVVRCSINSAGVGPSTSSRTSALTPSDSSSP